MFAFNHSLPEAEVYCHQASQTSDSSLKAAYKPPNPQPSIYTRLWLLEAKFLLLMLEHPTQKLKVRWRGPNRMWHSLTTPPSYDTATELKIFLHHFYSLRKCYTHKIWCKVKHNQLQIEHKRVIQQLWQSNLRMHYYINVKKVTQF